MPNDKTITYYRRGDVERGAGRLYRWASGYSADSPTGGVLYPWMTRRECQRDAKAQGARARFVEGDDLARSDELAAFVARAAETRRERNLAAVNGVPCFLWAKQEGPHTPIIARTAPSDAWHAVTTISSALSSDTLVTTLRPIFRQLPIFAPCSPSRI